MSFTNVMFTKEYLIAAPCTPLAKKIHTQQLWLTRLNVCKISTFCV